MFQKLKPVLCAVVVGCLAAFLIFRIVEEQTLSSPSGNAVAVQLGVFKDRDSADKLKESCGGEVFESDGIYRVYYSILTTDENIEFVTSHLKNLGISYYLKSMNVDNDTLKEGKEYENVMLKSKSDARLSINSELLNMYKEVIV